MHPSSSRRSLLATYLWPQWTSVALLVLLLLTSTGLQLVLPQIVRTFIDIATAGGSLPMLFRIAMSFVAVTIINQASAVAETYVAENVGWTATNALRADLARHCLALDISFHNIHTPGEMIERIDGDVTTLSNFFSRFIVYLLGSGLLLSGILVLLFREDWRVGMILSLFTFLALFIIHRSRSFAVPAFGRERQASADLYGFLEERLSGLVDIRANGGHGHVMNRLHVAQRNLFQAAVGAYLRGTWTWQSTTALFTLGAGIALGLGTWLFLRGSITIGTVYLLYSYTEMLRRPTELILRQVGDLQRASAGMMRIRSLFTLQPTIHDGHGHIMPTGPLSVAFDHVGFRYHPDTPVLRNVSLCMPPGRTLGLLGRTGSGKTTITRLLCRLYDPDQGSVRLGGVDLRDARLADLHQRVGIVTQDVQLFHASVRDNLTIFDPSITDERIQQVLADLGLTPWYTALPDGLNTQLAVGGRGLSAGEAQLLACARVFLRDPGLVILDEASSRLDPATEHLLERAMHRLLKGRTGIVIAHRLATVQRVDDVLIMEAGRVVEYGERRVLAADPASRLSRLLAVDRGVAGEFMELMV